LPSLVALKLWQPYYVYEEINMDRKRGFISFTSVELIQVVLKKLEKQKRQK